MQSGTTAGLFGLSAEMVSGATNGEFAKLPDSGATQHIWLGNAIVVYDLLHTYILFSSSKIVAF